MRVAIADDSPLFLDGLALLLGQAGIEVAAAVRSGAELCARMDNGLSPDGVVLDMHMPPTFSNEGLLTAAAVRSRSPSTAVVVLSTYAESGWAAQLLEQLGTNVGYLLKDRVTNISVLVEALERVRHGESVIDSEIVRGLLERQRRDRTLTRFTDREQQVLALLAQGRSNAGIARQLHLSVKTVERHIATIFVRIGAPEHSDDNRRVLAVLMWLRDGQG